MDLGRGRGKFFCLFAGLIGLLAIYSFFEAGALRGKLLALLALAIPAAGVYAVSEDRRRLILGLALGVPSLLGGLDAIAGIERLPGQGAPAVKTDSMSSAQRSGHDYRVTS